MTLSEITHATEEQVEEAIERLHAAYRLRLKVHRREVMKEMTEWNARLRREFRARHKKLMAYRDALKAEGPGE